MNILVTGGAGFIGSHTVTALLQSGHSVVVLDNLDNSNADVIERIKTITGKKFLFVQGDVRDSARVCKVLEENRIDAVFHFAALKSVGDSVAFPLAYYDCNIQGTLALLCAMESAGVRTLVFSSSATVYGDPDTMPVSEQVPLGQTATPYGYSKQVIERILEDVSNADPTWKIARLRYFNPVGAHESGLIGEEPTGTPNNLMPIILRVALQQQKILKVYGNDYPTKDGTGVRDYIHVMDLAEGHLAALEYLKHNSGLLTVNLGTGRGYSVLELIRAFEKASGRTVPFENVDRRPGDVAECWANPGLAEVLLGWKAKRTLDVMCRDTWRWASNG